MLVRANGLDHLINLLSRSYVGNVEKAKSGKSAKLRRARLIVKIFDKLLSCTEDKCVAVYTFVGAYSHQPKSIASACSRAIHQPLCSSC